MTFADISEAYAKPETAKIVLIPVSYDKTSTWIKGSAKGHIAFLEAARNMELYDIETGSEVYRKGIYLADPLIGYDTADAMVEDVYQNVNQYLTRGKFVTLVGGEHSVSIGAIRAFNEKYENLTVLQLDAHADLRPEYEGSEYNHACAMYEAAHTVNLVQVGIRSMDFSELQYMNKDKVFFAEHIYDNEKWFEQAIEKITSKVYITIDLDVLDPSIMPSTGTPEPGGLNWYYILKFLKRVSSQRNIVGFDIVELCPKECNKAPDLLAAKLYYKLLSYKFFNEKFLKR
ncbi:MAG: agmatinase [Bacteroidota bacterium]